MPGAHLDVELRVLVEVVEEFLVVRELSVPLARLDEPKVVTERNEKNRRPKQARLLPVLVQQEESPEGTDGNRGRHHDDTEPVQRKESTGAEKSKKEIRSLLTSPGHSAL